MQYANNLNTEDNVMKKLLCMAVLLSLALAPSAAEAYWLDISAGYWNPEPTGGVAYSLGVIEEAKADLADDLGMEKEGIAQIRAKLDLPLINFALMSTPLKYEGTGTMTQTVNFGGETFTATTPVTSKLDVNHTDIALFWGIPFLETATLNTLNVEFGLNARLVDVDASISGGGVSEQKSVSATIPMLYLGAQVTPTDSLSIEAEYRGISMDDNKYTDIMAMVKYKPVPLLYISAGYRTEKLELDEEGVTSDMEFKGPFAEVGLKF
jgi:outer membrane protein